ncbi:MAG: phosphodiester glycosidase family protein, partial [Acidimicrobiales bacterium]
VKDHGGKGLVAWAETTWYNHHKPPTGGVPSASQLPAQAAKPPPTTIPVKRADTPTPVPTLAGTPIAGEGVWQPTGRKGADGFPLLYTTFIRPDTIHTSLVIGLAWMDPKRVRFDLYSGSDQPGGPGWSLMAPIATDVRPSLVAAFNSGFKLNDSHGGYFAEGRQAPGHPLQDGKASLVMFKDGTATVGQWGRDVVMGPNVEAVRQNLVMLIDNGQEAANLNQNSLSQWGATVANRTFVWRSGVGVDKQGHLIYAGGELTVQTLADVLQAAGAVRAMELDINSTWVHFFSYQDDPAALGGTSGTRLLPAMSASTELYFRPSGRDFIAAIARPGV